MIKALTHWFWMGCCLSIGFKRSIFLWKRTFNII